MRPKAGLPARWSRLQDLVRCFLRSPGWNLYVDISGRILGYILHLRINTLQLLITIHQIFLVATMVLCIFSMNATGVCAAFHPRARDASYPHQSESIHRHSSAINCVHQKQGEHSSLRIGCCSPVDRRSRSTISCSRSLGSVLHRAYKAEK